MLHKLRLSPPRTTTPPAKIKAKVLFGATGDLRNHVLAVQEGLTPSPKQQEPTPPSSPKRKFAVQERLKSPSEQQELPSPSSPKRKKLKKKKRSSSYEESASPPPPPTPVASVAATAAPPEPAGFPDEATSSPPLRTTNRTSPHKKRRSSEDTNNKNRNSPQEKSPPAAAAARESPAEAVAAVPDEMLSASAAYATAATMPIPSRRSRRVKGPKKCHNCKTFQPNYLKCQFFMATGCKCGKHYCIACMSRDYSDDFDIDNTDEWQ
jgi:hypothetical protein